MACCLPLLPDFGAIRPASVAFVLPLVLPELPDVACAAAGVGNGVSFFCPPECFFGGGIVNEAVWDCMKLNQWVFVINSKMYAKTGAPSGPNSMLGQAIIQRSVLFRRPQIQCKCLNMSAPYNKARFIRSINCGEDDNNAAAVTAETTKYDLTAPAACGEQEPVKDACMLLSA